MFCLPQMLQEVYPPQRSFPVSFVGGIVAECIIAVYDLHDTSYRK